MAQARVALDPRAQADLDELAQYIRNRDGELRALHVIERIDKRLRTLASFPRIGRPTRRLEPGSRRFSIRPWIIYYDPAPEGIYVFRVVDGRRNLDALFRGNRDGHK